MAKEKIRDKEKTKQRLLNAVGKILKKEGYSKIRINKVAAVSGVNKKLIYDNFGGIDGLINAYLESTDFWVKKGTGISDSTRGENINSNTFSALLQNVFALLDQSEEMQKIILWGISEKNKMVRSITDEREKFGETLLQQTDKIFKKTGIDFRAVNAILVAAIYYIVLHGKTNGSTICGIDIQSAAGKQRISDAIKKIIEYSFAAAMPPQ